MHWCTQYIGRRWVSGGRGPDTFDCWGLAWWVEREHYGREIPCYPVAEYPERGATDVGWARDVFLRVQALLSGWVRTDAPIDGSVVVMNGGSHVGVYVEADGGLVLHAKSTFQAPQRGCGCVMAQPISALRLAGYRGIEFYSPQCPPTST